MGAELLGKVGFYDTVRTWSIHFQEFSKQGSFCSKFDWSFYAVYKAHKSVAYRAMAPGGVSNDADEFHPLDGYTLQIVLFSILVAAMISMGMLVWCANFVRKHLVKWTFHTTTPAGVKEVMQKISDLGNTEKREIVRQLMTKTTESEDCLLQEISSLRAKVQTLSEQNVQLQKQISVMAKSHGGATPSTSFNASVYVTKTGNHFHLDPCCQHLRQSSIEKKPCHLCALDSKWGKLGMKKKERVGFRECAWCVCVLLRRLTLFSTSQQVWMLQVFFSQFIRHC